MKNQVFYALNRTNHTACLLPGFSCWEQVQGAFRCGIRMPDGTMADAIGRCASDKQFASRAQFGEWSVILEQAFKAALNPAKEKSL